LGLDSFGTCIDCSPCPLAVQIIAPGIAPEITDCRTA